ncbi:hypothetical protein Q5P01_002803 [Channa striata]|uniref:Uncharacterized protein n=1 Tax=Channa striata TaxID=64152 RepID=A0AA88TEB0_CHASR|nr:hypothetical protein Q5P01_002803 [Channa striata]
MAEKKKRKRSMITDEPTDSCEKPSSSQVSVDESTGPSCVSMKSHLSMFDPINFGAESSNSEVPELSSCLVCKEVLRDPVDFVCGHRSCKQCLSSNWDQFDSPVQYHCPECGDSFHDKDTGDIPLVKKKESLKKVMQKKFAVTSEGNGDHESSLNSIYIELFITTGVSEEPHYEEHPLRHIERKFADSLNLNDIFKSLPDGEKRHRTVLMKGVAGIGKSFAVQKFILDWAEDQANQDVDFVFFIAFRELNLSTGEKSLNKLLTEFHPVLQDLKDSVDYVKTKIIVILDGLDESRLQLDFDKVKVVTSVSLADRIISHIQSSQSLDIMCQIPIFCWITALLFEDVFGEDKEAETPQTLTEMMSHFLFAQTKRRSRKYDKKTKENKEELLKTHREFLLKLGKLAFVHLLKNNLIFYEEDLENCGIDVKEASIYSGFCSSILREETFFSQKKVFFFVHLTIQEFFAALYALDCFVNNMTTEVKEFLNLKDKEQQRTSLDLLKVTVDKVLENNNGHLHYFLRFLLGLMVEPNWRVLQGLLTSPDPSQETDKKILTYLRSIKRKTISPDNCINLFQTMVEMRDYKVKDEIQEYLKLTDRSKTDLTPLHCSALAYMLQISKDDVDVLDLKTYNTTDEGRRRLIPAVRSSRKAMMKMIFRILLLISLISCVSGTFVVNVTQTSYQTEENHNITLEWTFTTKPNTSSTSVNILCNLFIDHKDLVLFHLHDGVEVSESQDLQFLGRVQFDKDVLREGQIRLQLFRLRTNDSGLYLCEVITADGWGSGTCRISVTAAADHPEPQRPTVSPEPQNRGWIGLYVGLGLTAVLLVLLCFALSRCFSKSTDKTENSSSVV